jgi:hypothetical protein
VADDTVINLLHMELFHNFEANVTGTLYLGAIWPQIIQWSLQEPFIMFALLCLSATHLATTNKDPSRYTQCALQLWTRSASLLRDKLSRPIDSTSVEQLIGASVLMQYIAWSHVEFLDEHQVSHGGDIPSCINMTHDPLFNLSSGVKDLYFEAFPALWGSHSAFLSTALYNPRLKLEEAIENCGLDPGAYVTFFTGIWEDPRFHVVDPSALDQQARPPSTPSSSSSLDRLEDFINSGQAQGSQSVHERLLSVVGIFRILSGCMSRDSPPQLQGSPDGMTPPLYPDSPSSTFQQDLSDAQRTAFHFVSRGVSIAMCLALISSERTPANCGTTTTTLTHLQSDIERYLFSFPIICTGTFRDLALQGDPRTLVVLLHFYHSTQVLLRGGRGWWARDRCRVMQSLIWKYLNAMGLDVYARVPVWSDTTASTIMIN